LFNGKYLPKNRGLPQSLKVGILRLFYLKWFKCVSIPPVTLDTLLAIVHCLATSFDLLYIGHHQDDYTRTRI